MALDEALLAPAGQRRPSAAAVAAREILFSRYAPQQQAFLSEGGGPTTRAPDTGAAGGRLAERTVRRGAVRDNEGAKARLIFLMRRPLPSSVPTCCWGRTLSLSHSPHSREAQLYMANGTES